MPQTITTGYKALCEAAEREIETLPTEEAIKLAGRDDTVLVDIRDIRELQREGKVPGAVHCPRGMLEFWIDPQSPYHKPMFAAGQEIRVLLRRRLALGAGRADRATHGPQAGRPYQGRLRRLEEAGRAGRSARTGAGGNEEGVSIVCRRRLLRPAILRTKCASARREPSEGRGPYSRRHRLACDMKTV